eukprot:8593136-Alexandrium_andersonii.AAC.1
MASFTGRSKRPATADMAAIGSDSMTTDSSWRHRAASRWWKGTSMSTGARRVFGFLYSWIRAIPQGTISATDR